MNSSSMTIKYSAWHLPCLKEKDSLTNKFCSLVLNSGTVFNHPLAVMVNLWQTCHRWHAMTFLVIRQASCPSARHMRGPSEVSKNHGASEVSKNHTRMWCDFRLFLEDCKAMQEHSPKYPGFVQSRIASNRHFEKYVHIHLLIINLDNLLLFIINCFSFVQGVGRWHVCRVKVGIFWIFATLSPKGLPNSNPWLRL